MKNPAASTGAQLRPLPLALVMILIRPVEGSMTQDASLPRPGSAQVIVLEWSMQFAAPGLPASLPDVSTEGRIAWEPSVVWVKRDGLPGPAVSRLVLRTHTGLVRSLGISHNTATGNVAVSPGAFQSEYPAAARDWLLANVDSALKTGSVVTALSLDFPTIPAGTEEAEVRGFDMIHPGRLLRFRRGLQRVGEDPDVVVIVGNPLLAPLSRVLLRLLPTGRDTREIVVYKNLSSRHPTRNSFAYPSGGVRLQVSSKLSPRGGLHFTFRGRGGKILGESRFDPWSYLVDQAVSSEPGTDGPND